MEPALEPQRFVEDYEAALATRDWSQIDHLIHRDACVTFSTGSTHKGKEAVRRAFEGNFRAISDERYEISNIHWVCRDTQLAVYLFDFDWTGTIRGKAARGGGKGTCVIVRDGPCWQMLVEHLGPRA